jgi:hypothetical protein
LKNLTIIFALFFLSLIIQSCVEDKASSIQVENSFEGKIIDRFSEIDVSINRIEDTSKHLFPISLLKIPDHSFLVIADYYETKIQLQDCNGSIYYVAGGKGKGPGEFESINQLHIGYDKHLYVLDLQLKRINTFEIANKKLTYSSTISLESDPTLYLQGIHVTEWGNFGLYHYRNMTQKSETQFLLYRLGHNFNPIEKLLTIPGDEQIEIVPNLFTDNFFGKRTLWDFDGKWFYYISSYNKEIKTFNLKTGKTGEPILLDLPERVNNPTALQNIKQHLNFINEDVYWKDLESRKTLPLFRNISVLDEQLYLSLFFPKSEHEIFLYKDLKSNSIKFLKTPYNFRLLANRYNSLYGINIDKQGNNQLMYLNLELNK